MTKIKKFRKNNWADDEEVIYERKNPKAKKFDRALRTKDIDYLCDFEEEDY